MLPSAPSKPNDSLGSRKVIIYGEPGIGKSTLMSEIPDSIVLATEAGLDQLTAMKWMYPDGSYLIKSWQDLRAATDEITESKRFKTIVIDTLGQLCWLAERYVLDKFGELHKSDGKLGYGKGASIILNELKRYFFELTQKGVGIWMTAHVVEETITPKAGTPYDRHIPFIPGDNKRAELLGGLIGMVDMCLFANVTLVGSEGNKKPMRVLRTAPSQDYIAKTRGERGAAPMLDPIPLSWKKLVQAYELTKKPATEKEVEKGESDGTKEMEKSDPIKSETAKK